MQELIILIVFLAALYYLGRLVYRAFFTKNQDAACSKGCASCSAIDLEKIETKLVSEANNNQQK